MNENPAFDVFGLGQCAYDHLLLVDRHPGPDEKAEGRGLTRLCGGPAATALWALAHWGRRTAFAGVVGDDEAGRRMRADLDEAGVDTTRMIVRPGERSQEAFIAATPGTGHRSIVWQRPTGAPPTIAELDAPTARVFLTDGLYAEASVACAKTSPCVVVDAGTLREGTEAMVAHADVFVASSSFAHAFLGRDDPRAAAEAIRRAGPAVAAVTRGAAGWVALCDDVFLEGPAHPVDVVVDTTGCGDVFHAGVVEGILRGWPWPTTFDFAAWAAAGCATRLGGRAGVPALDAYPYRA